MNMNPTATKEAGFLLYQKVKIAVAMILIKLTPPNSDVREYAATFQFKFRKKAERCNLLLEKQLFYNQLLLLLPALKIYSFDQHRGLYEPMETDDDSDSIISTFRESEDFLRECLQPSSVFSDNYFNYLHKINSIAQFLDAIVATKLLCDQNRNVTQVDVSKILSKFGETSFARFTATEPGEYSFISCSLLQYLMRSVDMNRIIVESAKLIIKLFYSYFENPVEQVFFTQGFITVYFANGILLKSVENYPHVLECREVLITFVRKSLDNLFFNISMNRDIGNCWYAIFSNWKRIEPVCIEILDSLFGVLKKFECDNRSKTFISERAVKIECALMLTRRFLNSYQKLHAVRKDVHKTKKLDDTDERKQCLKQYLKNWEKTLNVVIVQSISEHQTIVRLSWNCLKMIISLKCVMLQDNKKSDPPILEA